MPDLVIIAGCNGAGKSSFASSFLPEGVTSFDYDKVFNEIYNSLTDSELRKRIAKNKTTSLFKSLIKKAWLKNTDFCDETNFDSYPIYWATKFKDKGYQINLVFFCLDNQEIARHRVHVRTDFDGHYVDDKTIDLKWRAGYKNVNTHYKFFDNILFVDNSKQNDVYTNLLQIEKGKITLMVEKLPEYFKHRLPEIYSYIKNE